MHSVHENEALFSLKLENDLEALVTIIKDHSKYVSCLSVQIWKKTIQKTVKELLLSVIMVSFF